MNAAEILRERADSYGQDAETLRSLGHVDAAVNYEVIRDELRKVAQEVAAA